MNPEDMKKLIEDLEAEFKRLCENPKELKEASENLLDNLIDELTLELVFETHRSMKIGLQEMYEESYNEQEFVVTSTTDADKQQNVKKTQDCTCPICNRDVVPSRFAPHLENCMGMGRKRSRNASRIAANNNNNKEREPTYGSIVSDDEDDADWNSDKKKKKKTNSRIKKTKTSPKKNGEYTSADISYMNYDNMSEEEKKNLLMKFCGVVSEHTKKICSRSLRCALHSDEKRKALRNTVISDNDNSETVNVDIEGDDDNDSGSIRELLQDNSSTSSPADSASNSNSSSNSSKKREKSSKSKSKGRGGKERSSPVSNTSNE